jgi:hypothetical protein
MLSHVVREGIFRFDAALLNLCIVSLLGAVDTLKVNVLALFKDEAQLMNSACKKHDGISVGRKTSPSTRSSDPQRPLEIIDSFF